MISIIDRDIDFYAEEVKRLQGKLERCASGKEWLIKRQLVAAGEVCRTLQVLKFHIEDDPDSTSINIMRNDGMPPQSNHWDLYATIDGWEKCAHRLDILMILALHALDRSVENGEMPFAAALVASDCMLSWMDAPENTKFGSGDTEPRSIMLAKIKVHLKTRHGVDWVD